MDIKLKKYCCELCPKSYDSRTSLWTHKNNHHNNMNSFNCEYCSNIYLHKHSKINHEKKCVVKNNKLELKIEKMKAEQKKQEAEQKKQEAEIEKMKVEQQKQELKQKKQEIEIKKQEIKKEEKRKKQEIEQQKQNAQAIKLQIKLQKAETINTKTFNAVNKALKIRSEINTINNNTINNNTINNNNTIIINNIIIGGGKENVLETITEQEKFDVMNERMNALQKMIEIVHCGNYTQFKNILITNLKAKNAYQFDHNKGYFISANKNDILEDMVTRRTNEIEEIYEEYSTIISEITRQSILRFIENMNNESDKLSEINKINKLLYNNNEKIKNDIALLL